MFIFFLAPTCPSARRPHGPKPCRTQLQYCRRFIWQLNDHLTNSLRTSEPRTNTNKKVILLYLYSIYRRPCLWPHSLTQLLPCKNLITGSARREEKRTVHGRNYPAWWWYLNANWHRQNRQNHTTIPRICCPEVFFLCPLVSAAHVACWSVRICVHPSRHSKCPSNLSSPMVCASGSVTEMNKTNSN